MPPNKKFQSADVDISFIAALYHPLFIAIENKAVSITGMKLWYCLHRSRSSAYTVQIIIISWVCISYKKNIYLCLERHSLSYQHDIYLHTDDINTPATPVGHTLLMSAVVIRLVCSSPQTKKLCPLSCQMGQAPSPRG
jgi:hypothetical protein